MAGRTSLALLAAVALLAASHHDWRKCAFLESTTGGWASCPSPLIVDGDTLRCGAVRVRLLGIDAPELHGCPSYRRCAPGSGKASRRSLQIGATNGPVRFLPVAIDRYGRTVAVVTAGNLNLSCWQLEQGEAIYKPAWDNGGRIAKSC